MCEYKNKIDGQIAAPIELSGKIESPITIDNYLLEVLGMDTKQVPNETKELIKNNFVHLMCVVIKDLQIVDERINKYRIQRKSLESDKSNGAEYKRRKLDYFAQQNKQAKWDIVEFLISGVKEYFLQEKNSTLECEFSKNELGWMRLNRRYSFSQFPEYYDAEYDYSTIVKVSFFQMLSLLINLIPKRNI